MSTPVASAKAGASPDAGAHVADKSAKAPRILDRCHNIADLREIARRRLPRGVFEFFDRGSEDETAATAIDRGCDAGGQGQGPCLEAVHLHGTEDNERIERNEGGLQPGRQRSNRPLSKLLHDFRRIWIHRGRRRDDCIDARKDTGKQP